MQLLTNFWLSEIHPQMVFPVFFMWLNDKVKIDTGQSVKYHTKAMGDPLHFVGAHMLNTLLFL